MKNRKCQSCGIKLSQFHDEDVCDECWEKSDREDEQLVICVICGAEIFDSHELCDGCKEEARDKGYEDDE